MNPQFKFVPRKKRVGAYFNDGCIVSFVQADSDSPRADDDILMKAVRAARDAFFLVYKQELEAGGGLRPAVEERKA